MQNCKSLAYGQSFASFLEMVSSHLKVSVRSFQSVFHTVGRVGLDNLRETLVLLEFVLPYLLRCGVLRPRIGLRRSRHAPRLRPRCGTTPDVFSNPFP